MKFGTPKEVIEGENRVAMTPDSAQYLQKLGYSCLIESGAGTAAGFSDALYEAAGVTVIKTTAALWKDADIVAKVRQPERVELKYLNEGQTLISFFNPATNEIAGQKRRQRDRNGHGAAHQPGAERWMPFRPWPILLDIGLLLKLVITLDVSLLAK